MVPYSGAVIIQNFVFLLLIGSDQLHLCKNRQSEICKCEIENSPLYFFFKFQFQKCHICGEICSTIFAHCGKPQNNVISYEGHLFFKWGVQNHQHHVSTRCISISIERGKIRHKFRTAIANDPITPLKNMIHFGKTALNWMKMNNNTMVELYCQKDPDSHSVDLCT